MTAEGAVAGARRLSEMFTSDRAAIEQQGRRAGSLLRVHEALVARPILSLSEIRKRTTLAFATASSAMEWLVDHGIAREITGKRRDRLFVYDQYLSILSEGTEVP